jgi:radical SAM protein with 4Fe4S-binding SPASM domain
MVKQNLFLKRFPKQHYSTLFNSESGFFLRIEDLGFELPFWSESGPELLDISITRWCDRECLRCYRTANTYGKHMQLEHYNQIMEQAHKLPVMQVALGGGNPNQHPDFCKILQMTREEYGIVPSYTTNGRGLTKEVLEASSIYCGAVAVSAYSPYKELELAIKKLTLQGIKTNIHFVLDKDSITTAIQWLKEPPAFLSAVNALIFLNYKPFGRIEEKVGLLRESSLLTIFFDKVQKFKNCKIGFDSCLVSGLVSYTNIHSVLFEGCDAGRFSMFISEDMRAYPCSFMVNTHSGADLENKTILETWTTGDEFIKIRQRLLSEKCGKCSKKMICLGGCPKWESINLC